MKKEKLTFEPCPNKTLDGIPRCRLCNIVCCSCCEYGDVNVVVVDGNCLSARFCFRENGMTGHDPVFPRNSRLCQNCKEWKLKNAFAKHQAEVSAPKPQPVIYQQQPKKSTGIGFARAPSN
jgi:hypothetical protein